MPGRRVGKRHASGASSTSSRKSTDSKRSSSQPPTTPTTKDNKNKVISPRSELANDMKRNFSLGKEEQNSTSTMGDVTPSSSQLKKLKTSNSSDDVNQMQTDEEINRIEEKLSKRSLVDNQDSYLLDKFNSLPSGTIHVVGQGNTGQLGCGEDIMERKKPYPVKDLDGVKIKVIACGGMHTACIDDEHKVYTWGCNDEGALGRTCASDEEEMVPGEVSFPEDAGKAVSLTCGDSHCAVLDDVGQVYRQMKKVLILPVLIF